MTEASSQKTPEALMLERYHAGDNGALDELVEAYQESAFWIARHKVHDDEAAADVVQEAFIRVIRRSELYDSSRPFKAWFLQIVRNLSIDYLRRRRVHASQDVAENIESDHDLQENIAREELSDRIQTVLQSLPEKYRELIQLRDIEGYGPDEIATMMNADYGTTRWRVHQARKQFRKEWIARYGEDSLE